MNSIETIRVPKTAPLAILILALKLKAREAGMTRPSVRYVIRRGLKKRELAWKAA